MATNSPRPGRAPTLTARRRERGVFDRLIEAVRTGESQVLVVRGDPGVGKSVLLDYLVSRARGCRVAHAVGVQSEMELAFAGLHQLCAPMLDHLGAIPEPQREALRTAFGISLGPPPDRFLVGLAVLSLLSEVAGERPLICVIDDEQWLDHASAQALGFVARRLAADPVGLVFAARVPGAELAGLPELALEGLAEGDARALLDSALAGPLDERVRDQIVAETQGNPLALLELPRGLTLAELAGGFGLPGAVPLSGRIEESFQRQLDALPPEVRRLVQLAAAGPLDELQSARVDLLRGQVAFASGLSSDAPPLLLKAAKRLEPLNLELARETYLSAWMAALFAGRFAGAGDLLEVSRAARGLRPAPSPRPVDLALDGLTLLVTDGPTAAASTLRQAASAFASADISVEEGLRWGWLAQAAASSVWDDERWRAILLRQVQIARDVGALDQLPIDLGSLGTDAAWSGDFAGALARLTETTQAGQTDFGLGIEARSRALLSEGEAAEGCYREAIDRLGRTQLRPELARAHLLYGEWLRRESRRADARVPLRTAHELLATMGAEAFAERARRELVATGETARKRTVETLHELTAQEASIARLARDGRTNPEIGAQLFLSARTVEWHLRKVFTKLGISSRRELHGALANIDQGGLSAQPRAPRTPDQ